jgi:hypothetical protein
VTAHLRTTRAELQTLRAAFSTLAARLNELQDTNRHLRSHLQSLLAILSSAGGKSILQAAEADAQLMLTAAGAPPARAAQRRVPPPPPPPPSPPQDGLLFFLGWMAMSVSIVAGVRVVAWPRR